MLSLPRIAIFAILSALWIAFTADHALASRRVALVVGNAAYQDPALVLANPRSDAEAVAKALVNLGFDVTLALNATTRDMDMALKRFGDQASAADVALFFYAGHALQYQGNNFLMPVDGTLEDEVDLRRNMVTDEQIRVALERTNGVRIMILDACRNNPMADRFKRTVLGMTRSLESTRGLARIDKAQGMVIAYAAAPGDVALDGNTMGRNSPFTAALVRRMQEPALEISTMFRRVISDVWDTTKGRQRPEYSSTLRNDYYLDPVADRRIWERVRDLNDAAAINEFIAQFPYSAYIPEAQRRLELLQRSRREREEQARLDRERQDAERTRREACHRESQELALMGDDLSRLVDFAQRVTCDDIRSIAQERIKAVTAALDERNRRDQARRREEEARLNAERCRIEQATVDALRNDLAKLRDLAARATCQQARDVANRAINTLLAQSEAEERNRQQAERVCRDEQQALTAIWSDPQKLQTIARQATCEQVRITAAERAKTLATKHATEALTARMQAERVCQTEQAQAITDWNSAGKLQDLAKRAECPEVKASIAARVEALATEERQTLAEKQQAAERLAALEEERNRQRREEEKRRQDEQARQRAEAKCKEERVELATIESNLATLRTFVKRSECEEVRTLGTGKITQLEREEKICKEEDSKRNSFLTQAKRLSDRTRLAALRTNLTKLDQDMTCTKLRSAIAENITMVKVKLAQIELKRHGCFTTATDGVMDDGTRKAAKLFLAKIGHPDGDSEITDELLSDLVKHKDPVCKEIKPSVVKRIVNERRQAAPQRPARARATASSDRPAPAPRPGVTPGSMIVIGN